MGENKSLNEYIGFVKRKTKFYLKDILDSNEEDNYLIKNLSNEFNRVFNMNPTYRNTTQNFVIEIKRLYDSFVAEKLEFASSKEEVNMLLDGFERDLRKSAEKYKNMILKKFNESTGYKTNILNNNMDLKVKIIKEGPREQNEIPNLKYIIIAIYALIEMIKDKSIKQNNLLDVINTYYSVRDENYTIALAEYIKCMNEHDYETYNTIYEESIEKLMKPKTR